jgi:hypothetical protein
MFISFLGIGAFQGALKTENEKTRSGCAVRVLNAVGTDLSVSDQIPATPFPQRGGQQHRRVQERPERSLIVARISFPARGVKRGEP